MAASVLCLLAACGGGGTTTPGATPPVATTTITGTVGNASGAPVVDATVSLGTGATTPVTTQTNTSGNFVLPVPPSAVNTDTVVVVTVAKEGYKTCTGTVSPTDSTVTGCTILPLAALDELHPVPADAGLVRLGDGETSGGGTNSKLQLPAPLGLSKTIALGWPANINLADYQTFTVNVDVRGMQAFTCADRVTVLQGATAAGATAVKTFSAANVNLIDSDSLGAFSAYALPVATSLLNATAGNIYVKLEAGICVDGTPGDPADDYEFVGLFGKFS